MSFGIFARKTFSPYVITFKSSNIAARELLGFLGATWINQVKQAQEKNTKHYVIRDFLKYKPGTHSVNNISIINILYIINQFFNLTAKLHIIIHCSLHTTYLHTFACSREIWPGLLHRPHFLASELSRAFWDLYFYSFPCGCLQLSFHTTRSLANFPTGCEIDWEQKYVRQTQLTVCESPEHALGWGSFCFGQTSRVCLSLKRLDQSQTKTPYTAQLAVSNECIHLMYETGEQAISSSRFLCPQLDQSRWDLHPQRFTHSLTYCHLCQVAVKLFLVSLSFIQQVWSQSIGETSHSTSDFMGCLERIALLFCCKWL